MFEERNYRIETGGETETVEILEGLRNRLGNVVQRKHGIDLTGDDYAAKVHEGGYVILSLSAKVGYHSIDIKAHFLGEDEKEREATKSGLPELLGHRLEEKE